MYLQHIEKEVNSLIHKEFVNLEKTGKGLKGFNKKCKRLARLCRMAKGFPGKQRPAKQNNYSKIFPSREAARIAKANNPSLKGSPKKADNGKGWIIG